MLIGLLICGYKCEESIHEVLRPWLEVRDEFPIILSFIHTQFKEYADFFGKDEIIRPKWLSEYQGKIDYFHQLEPCSEVEGRNRALESLIKNDVDYIWQLDADEFYTKEQIRSIINYIECDKFIAWYKVSFQNFVLDENHYLSEPFTPPRIYRTKIGKWKLDKFTGDNDISYLDEEKQVSHLVLGNKVIPTNIAFVRHMTWLNNEASKNKVRYHQTRWGHCSYKWDNDLGLQIDSDYYTKLGLSIPKILSIN